MPAWGSEENSRRQWWTNWRKTQNWSPQRSNNKAAKWNAEYEQKLSEVQTGSADVEEDLPQQGAPVEEEDWREGAAKRKRAAQTISRSLALQATLDPEDEEMQQILADHIARAREETRVGKSRAQILREAEENLAAALVKNERAQKHEEEARDSLARSSLEVQRARAELLEIKSRHSRPKAPQTAPAASRDLEKLARTLASLKNDAVFQPDGRWTVSAEGLESVATLVSALAGGEQPADVATSSRRSTPPTNGAAGRHIQEVLIHTDGYTSETNTLEEPVFQQVNPRPREARRRLTRKQPERSTVAYSTPRPLATRPRREQREERAMPTANLAERMEDVAVSSS